MKTGIFQEGNSYRVRCDFDSGIWKFAEGEILIFQKEGYDRYDEAQIFEFLDSTGQKKLWAVFDRYPANWVEYFDPL